MIPRKEVGFFIYIRLKRINKVGTRCKRAPAGNNPVQVDKNKWRSQNGKWQYRAKPIDVNNKHIHIEELNTKTGEVINNYHLYWK